jgi:hypothetical protein
MPKRIVDGEGIWLSNKLASMGAIDAIPILLYAWLLPIAEHNGVFEYDPRAIHKRTLAYHDILEENELVDCLNLYRDAGLLFVWTEQKDGKEYGYWVGSDKKGRLPGKEYSKRYSWPPEPPKSLLGKYIEESNNSVKITENQCKGLGLGLGEGVGLGAPTPDEEKTDMAIIRRISDSCLQILGVRVPYGLNQLGNPDGDALKQAARIYGEQEVQDAFESWADTQKGTTDPYLISKFVRIMGGLLRGISLVSTVDTPNLKALGATLYEIGNQVFTNQQLAGLLKDYSKDELEAAYQEFVHNLDDFSIKFAARDFCNGGADAIIAARKEREQKRLKQEKLATVQQNKLATAATSEASEAEKQLKAEEEIEQEALRELVN